MSDKRAKGEGVECLVTVKGGVECQVKDSREEVWIVR